MDIVTHGLAGALVARAGFEQRVGRVATVALVIGALLPDVHVVLSFWDQMAVVRYHRGLTHSVFGGAALALAAAWPLWRFARGARVFQIAGLLYLGILVHIGLDLPTSFGTMALAPLTWRRFALDWVFIVDFLPSGIVAAGLLLGWVWRDLRARIARTALVGVGLDLGIAAVGHEGALRRWSARLEAQSVAPQSVAAIPVLGSPLVWKGLAETGEALQEGLHHIVEFTDLRYGSRREINGMTLRVVLDGSGGVRGVAFNHRF